jgi:16S rRNA G966 N2-methylase RsmD
MQEVKTDRCIPIRGDVFKFVSKSKEQFDFIFADPPYDLRELETLPDLIFQNNLLKEDGLFVLEHGKTSHFEDHPHFIEKRVYGSVNFSFFSSVQHHIEIGEKVDIVFQKSIYSSIKYKNLYQH